MSTADENKAGLVRSQPAALSRSGTTSLIRRGEQDLLAREEAEEWCKTGSSLWHQQRYEEAVECFRRGLQLDPNDAFLQFRLGAAYYQGNGVPERDYTQAEFWLRKAAEQGHAASQAVLGIMCEWSFGVPQDYAQALAWYRKAAEHGEVLAQFNLGVIYGFGRGVLQDDAEAVFWYRKAAERGNAEAQFNLGVMYRRTMPKLFLGTTRPPISVTGVLQTVLPSVTRKDGEFPKTPGDPSTGIARLLSKATSRQKPS